MWEYIIIAGKRRFCALGSKGLEGNFSLQQHASEWVFLRIERCKNAKLCIRLPGAFKENFPPVAQFAITFPCFVSHPAARSSSTRGLCWNGGNFQGNVMWISNYFGWMEWARNNCCLNGERKLHRTMLYIFNWRVFCFSLSGINYSFTSGEHPFGGKKAHRRKPAQPDNPPISIWNPAARVVSWCKQAHRQEA